MPSGVSPHDRAIAEIALKLLACGAICGPVSGEFEVPTPPGTTAEADPDALMRFEAPLPSLAGQRTRLVVEQAIEGAVPVRLVRADTGTVRLLCRAESDDAAIVMRLGA